MNAAFSSGQSVRPLCTLSFQTAFSGASSLVFQSECFSYLLIQRIEIQVQTQVTGGLERTGKERTGKRWKEPEIFLLVGDIGKKREKNLFKRKFLVVT